MLTFEPFRIWHDRQRKKKSDLRTECGLSDATITKIFADRLPVRSDVIETLCRVYKLKVEQVIEYREGGIDGRKS